MTVMLGAPAPAQRWRDVLVMEGILHRGRRSSLLLPLVALALAWPLAGFYALISVAGESQPPAALEVMTASAASSALVQLLALFAGVVVGAADARPSTIPGGLLASPRRSRFVLARMCVALLWWLPTGLLAAAAAPVAVGIVLGVPALLTVPAGAVAQLLGSAALASGLAALLGAALGLVVGVPLWAAGIGFAAFSVLPLVLAGADGPREFLPGPALAQLVSADAVPAAAVVAVGVWTLLALGCALLVVNRRSY